MSVILNEVLSITAQESAFNIDKANVPYLLNEVLSITAQESCRKCGSHYASTILNEVLSITAQEFNLRFELGKFTVSSMKS